MTRNLIGLLATLAVTALLIVSMTACADPTLLATRELVTGKCITATTGSLSITNASGTVFAKSAETVVFCPPAIVANVTPGPVVAASAPGK